MSLLRRMGNNRNNIEWYSSTNTSGQYLQRTSTNRNDISFINISSNGTYNLLNRISNGINDIQWKNTTFSFGIDLRNYPLYTNPNGNNPYNFYWVSAYTINRFVINTINKTSYTNFRKTTSGRYDISYNCYFIIYYQGSNSAEILFSELKNNCTKMTINCIRQDPIENNFNYDYYFDELEVFEFDALSNNRSSISIDYSNDTGTGNYPDPISITFS